VKNHKELVLYESFYYIVPLVLLSLVVTLIGRPYLNLLTLPFAIFMAFFFRNPERKIPEGDNIFVSPADGKVILIQNVDEEEGLKALIKISIFLSLFDVHVNRMPCSGEVVDIKYKKGRFSPAFTDKASQENEQVAVLISHNSYKILVKQIAGVIARRIVCWADVGDRVERGERYGIIRFGSRVDLFIPDKTEVMVKIGDKVKGGKTILGVLK
jgi:phosphatidylserine decarboxylase